MIAVFILSMALFGASAQNVCTNTNICPDGWVQVEGTCYQFNKDTMDWASAQERCKSQGGHLYEPASAAEGTQVRAYAEGVGLGNFWIGVTDNDQEGTWVYASSGETVTINNWYSGEPNNYDHGDGEGENCAEIYSGGLWNDARCSSSDRNYICTYEVQPWIVAAFEYKKFPCDNGFTLMNDGCYAFFGNNEVTYAEAKATCESVGAKLFEPQSLASHSLIHDWIYGMFRGDTKYWLGITRQSSGDFGYASNGKSLAFTLWNDNEPNNSGDNENCVDVNQDDNSLVEGKWNDWSCDNKARFVCEMPLPSFEVKMKEV